MTQTHTYTHTMEHIIKARLDIEHELVFSFHSGVILH